jgi:hypothetical protein
MLPAFLPALSLVSPLYTRFISLRGINFVRRYALHFHEPLDIDAASLINTRRKFIWKFHYSDGACLRIANNYGLALNFLRRSLIRALFIRPVPSKGPSRLRDARANLFFSSRALLLLLLPPPPCQPCGPRKTFKSVKSSKASRIN